MKKKRLSPAIEMYSLKENGTLMHLKFRDGLIHLDSKDQPKGSKYIIKRKKGNKNEEEILEIK